MSVNYLSILQKIKEALSDRWTWFKAQMAILYKKWILLKEAYPRGAWLALIGGSLGLLSFIFVLIFYLSIRFECFDTLPTLKELQEIENNIASEIYTEDGQLLGKYYIQNRINVSLEEISPDLLDVLVATEDVRFFDHDGIDFRAWFRVFFKSILMGDESAGGGSTLSQQLAKNLYSRKNYLLLSLPVNKVREMIIAQRLERIYSKKELLTLYLNTVSFSDNTYGVKVASKRFFDTSPTAITIEEAAVLVGMLKNPSLYNPIKRPELTRERRNVVLSQMAKYGHITKEDLDSLQAQPLRLKYSKEGFTEGKGTYFREHLRLELKELLKEFTKEDGGSYNLYTDGLKIYTTLDSRLQQYAEESVTEHLKKLQADFFKHWKGRLSKEMRQAIEKIVSNTDLYKRLKAEGKPQSVIEGIFKKPRKMTIFTWEGEEEREMSKLDSIQYYFMLLNTGFLVMNPQNGHIKAWVGGINNKYFQYDHVKSVRQVGSIFKPLVYAAALEQGIPPCEYTYNQLTIYSDYEDWSPENSDGVYGGVYSMEGALSKSINAVTVDLIMRTGIDSVKDLAHQMGVSTPIPVVPSIALGAVDVSLFDMLKVYGTFANGGRRPNPTYIRRIETKTGEVLLDVENAHIEPEQVLSANTSQIMTQMLQSVVDSGTAKRLRYQYRLYNDIAGKTGTTQNHSDGWFIGYTPNLVAGAWVGGESPTVRFRTLNLGQGANMALPIWGRFMNKVYKDVQFEDWKAVSFEPLSDSIRWKLDCAPYLEEMPIYVNWDHLKEHPATLFEIIFGKKEVVTFPAESNQNKEDRGPNAWNKRKRKQKKKERLFDRIFRKRN